MPSEDPATHWKSVYTDRPTEELTWYQRRPTVSLDLLETIREEIGDDLLRLIDVGAGASTLEDHLVARPGWNITALDVTPTGLQRIRDRLDADETERIDWLVADITEPLDELERFDVWHDRAVFHFLTDESDRETYRANLRRAVRPAGRAVVSTFSPRGPQTCTIHNTLAHPPDVETRVVED
ncbi:MAG: trans-aconitate 2-methyltransferase [Bradymonadaceae bacterium]